MITAKIGCAIVAGLAFAAHAQSQCPSSDAEFQQSLRAHPPIPPGKPDGYDPRRPGR